MTRAATPSVRRFWVVALVALALLTLVGAVVREHYVQRRWKAMLAELDAFEAEIATHVDRRPPLYGSSHEGKAAESYEAAWASLPADDAVWDAIVGMERPIVVDGALASAVSKGESSLEHLRIGACAHEVGLTVLLGRATGTTPSRFMFSNEPFLLGWLSVAAVAVELELGDPERGVERLLDFLQYVRDLLQAPDPQLANVGAVLLLGEGMAIRRLLEGPFLAELPTNARGWIRKGIATALDGMPPTSSGLAPLFARGFAKRRRASRTTNPTVFRIGTTRPSHCVSCSRGACAWSNTSSAAGPWSTGRTKGCCTIPPDSCGFVAS